MGDNDIRIRKAVRDDAAAIAALIRELAESTGEAHRIRSTAADFERHGFGDRPAFLGLLAEKGGDPVGLALWFYDFSSWRGDLGIYLQDLYVRDELRGSGLGKRLLQGVIRAGLADGATHLRLSVATGNASARAFYAHLGFTYRDDECIYQVADDAMRELAIPDEDGNA